VTRWPDGEQLVFTRETSRKLIASRDETGLAGDTRLSPIGGRIVFGRPDRSCRRRRRRYQPAAADRAHAPRERKTSNRHGRLTIRESPSPAQALSAKETSGRWTPTPSDQRLWGAARRAALPLERVQGAGDRRPPSPASGLAPPDRSAGTGARRSSLPRCRQPAAAANPVAIVRGDAEDAASLAPAAGGAAMDLPGQTGDDLRSDEKPASSCCGSPVRIRAGATGGWRASSMG